MCGMNWHGHVECSDGWLKEVQKLNPVWGHGHDYPNKTGRVLIHLDDEDDDDCDDKAISITSHALFTGKCWQK